MVSNRFSVNREVNLVLTLAIFLLAGCTSRHLVPVSNGGTVNPKLQSITRAEEGVTVTVRSSAWHGEPSSIEDYVTPLYVVIQNDTDKNLAFGYEDLALFDESRTQYNPLRPETVSKILEARYQRRYAFRPYFSLGFGYSSFRHYRRSFFFSPFFYDPFYFDPFYPAWYYPPTYYPERLDNVFTQALIPGLVRPNAKLEGFIYFKKIPSQVQRVTLEVGYKFQGEPESYKLGFPFAVEVRRP